jgi:hypothetical protein
MDDSDKEVNSLEFMGEKVPAIMLTLQRSSQYLKEIIKGVKLEAHIAYT